jgi:hypothetical protein
VVDVERKWRSKVDDVVDLLIIRPMSATQALKNPSLRPVREAFVQPRQILRKYESACWTPGIYLGKHAWE